MKTTIKTEPVNIMRSIISPESLIEPIRANYPNISPLNISLLSVADNDNYLVQAQDQNYVLRIYRHNKHWLSNQESYIFEFQLLNFLHQNGISVSYPIAGKDGDYLRTIQAPEGIRYWSLFSFAPGELMRFNPENCYNYGRIISSLHLVTNSFSTSVPHLNIDTNFLLDKPLERIRNYLGLSRKRDLDNLTKLVQKLKNKINNFDQNKHGNKWGVIGGDFHGGNHFCDKHGRITLFDFDLCGYGWRMYDIAVFKWALFNICKRAPKLKNRALLWESFLKGYESHIPISQEQARMISVFVQVRQIWLMGSETTYQDKILDKGYWDKMFQGLKISILMDEENA